MKKNIVKILLAAALLNAAYSCTRDFEELNLDTSKVLEVQSGQLLNPALFEMASQAYLRANDFTFDVMQYSLDFPNEGNTYSRYYLTENSGVGYWNHSYKWLKQIREMLILAEKEGDNNNKAVALVLQSWGYANLTDSFGDIPFTEANALDEEIRKPKFDKQKDVYLKLLNDLDAANKLFNTAEKLKGHDQLYSAETDAAGILKWKKFCNTLSLRLLLRILDRDGEIDVKNRIKKIVNNPAEYPIFDNNKESAFVKASGTAPFDAPIARPQDFTTGLAAADFFVRYLNDTKDPRLSKFFSKARDLNNKDIGYKGIPSGYKAGTVFDYTPSNLNQNLAKTPLTIKILGYSELQFILAELALKGIVSGDPKTFYENGVKASVEQWDSTMPATYLAQPLVAYDGTLERIMMQKYIALFFVDQQAWYEYRRTGFPKLQNNGGLLNNAQMPSRFMYTPNSKLLNSENYNAAVQSMGGDDINTKVWWDK